MGTAVCTGIEQDPARRVLGKFQIKSDHAGRTAAASQVAVSHELALQ